MLGEQYYSNPKFHPYFDAHFVLLRADRDEKLGADLFKKFNIRATPTVMTIDGAGAEVDWEVGYGPPAETFHARMTEMVEGQGTFKGLQAAWAKDPRDAATAFGLARKWADRYDDAKTQDFYRQVVALDPAGKSGVYKDDYYKTSASYTEYAEFALGGSALSGANRSPAAMKAFIAKYPKSQLQKQAYARLSGYYGSAPSKDEATAFFAEYAGKFPDDPEALVAWLGRITRDKGDFAKGTELADKIKLLNRSNPLARTSKALADFYLAKGDAEAADLAYGKDYMKSRASSLAYDMIDYAMYWAGKGQNLEAATAAAETAMKLYPTSTYFVQQAAGVYLKAGQEAKSMALFGPAFAKAHWDDSSALEGYAYFWASQTKNLDDALKAARRAIELKPGEYYNYYALSQVLLARKDYAGALQAAEKTVELADDAIKDYYRKQIDKIKAAQAGDKK